MPRAVQITDSVNGNSSSRAQTKLTWNVKTVKLLLNLMLAFSGGGFLTFMVTQWTGQGRFQYPLNFWSSGNRSSTSDKLSVDNLPNPLPYEFITKDVLLSATHQELQGDEFLSSKAFESFVKKKGNFSSVADYLLSVKSYLLTFRSPMIKEEPSEHSCPETESERRERQSLSKTKYIVYYNPPPNVQRVERRFAHCPVNNCVFSLNYARDHKKADVVMFHVAHGPPSKAAFRRDHSDQMYVFNTLESAKYKAGYDKTTWNSAFNWTWNFRIDSDIFCPVGYLKRSVSMPSHQRLLERKHRKKKHVAWMSSHCNVPSKRDKYVKRLRKIIPVDIYGECGDLVCKRHTPECSTILNDYFFYLSFENSMCVDYITEKYYKTFLKGLTVLPVVRGGGNYSRYFPSGTFIDAERFASPEDLGRYLLSLADDDAEYVDMAWRKAHFVYHEHGQYDAYCQLCYKAHHIERFKQTYSDMFSWYHKDGCFSPKPF